MTSTAAPLPTSASNSTGAIRSLELAMIASVAVPLALLAATAVVDYDRVMRQSTEHVHKTASIAEEHALKVLETSEVIIGRVLDLVADDSDARIATREERLHQKLQEIQRDIEQVQNIYAWGPAGEAVLSSRYYPSPRVSIRDREDFAVHLEQRIGAYVTRPLVGRASGERFFNISRRRETPEGRFAGVVTVSLRPQYFSDFYRELSTARGGMSISIWRQDGVLLARYPDPGEPVQLRPDSALAAFIASGKDTGETRGLSGVDGVERLIGFRKIGRYSLYISAGLDKTEIMSEWYRNLAISALFAVSASLGLLLVTWLALQKTRREQAALAQWRVESERRANAEEQLRQAQKLEAIGQLTGGVAHDFNNLLQVVSTNLYILKLKLRGADVDAQLSAIARAVASGETLTKHLLAFSRRRPLQPRTMVLQESFDEIQTLIRQALRGDVTLRCSLQPGLWPLDADAEELQMALLNIAVNARDALPEGGIVTLEARNATLTATEPGVNLRGDFVAISVTDTGYGIPPEVLEHVFEPFFTTKAVGKGTGLGLSQVYGFAIQSGGAATIASTMGHGTTVTLYLPRSQRAPEADRKSGDARAHEPDCGCILLVEDNPEIGDAVSAVLRETGYSVRHVGDADQALATLGDDPDIDLLITDIVMPGSMSGLDLARVVRRHYPGVPVLLMSGYTAEADKAAAEGYRILSKPFRPEALADAIRRTLRRQSRPPYAPGGSTVDAPAAG
jgi:two-component system NtrC family sensor kinase